MIRATHLAAGALVLAVPLGLIGAPAAYAQGDIVAQLRESPQFSMFANLIEAAGLVEELKDVGPYTVFAPTDQAFNRLPQGALDQLRQGQNQGQLEDLIKHHVILGEAYPSDELPERLEPLEGGPLDVGIADSGAVLRPEGGQQVAVTEGDIEAENGIIHAIEGVLIPREVAQALPAIQAQQQTAQAQQQQRAQPRQGQAQQQQQGRQQAGRGGQQQTGRAAAEPAASATYSNRHADLDAGINSGNVGRMQLAWKLETDAPVSHVPLVEDGRVYFADWNGTVYAVNAASGEPIWQKKVLEQPKKEWPWHGFAGTGALGQGMLFEASVEGEAYALDTETGEVVWRTRIADDPEAGNVGKLTYYDGLIYIGLSSVEEPLTKMKQGFEPNFQGKVLALDAGSGRLVWERPLVTPPHNGVPMWSSFALDPRANTLYFTTGNNYTGEASELSDAIVAVDAKTGEILWADQVTQHDVWTMANPEGPDYDFAGGPQLFEATIDGEPRRLVGAGQKSGFFHAWDRVTGEPVWATSIGYGGVDGGLHGEASIGDGRIYAWSNNNYIHTEPPDKAPMSIKALDAATGRHLWVKDKAQPAGLFMAGFLAGDVYLVGALDGRVRAYRASDGKELWTSEPQGPIISSLWVDGDTLYFGTGAPGLFGDWAGGPNGLFAYRPMGS